MSDSRSRKIPVFVSLLLFGSTLAVGSLIGERAEQDSAPTAVVLSSGMSLTQAGDDGVLHLEALSDRTTIMAGGDRGVKVRLTLTADPGGDDEAAVTPTDLLVLLDTSGSMEGQKLVDAKEAIRDLIGALSPGDRFALLSYSDGVTWSIPFGHVQRFLGGEIEGILSGIQAEGSTNIGAALEVAKKSFWGNSEGGAVSRVVLLSDGQPTAGVTSSLGLGSLAEQVRLAGHSLSTVGVGQGFNEMLMSSLADLGQGNYYYASGDQDLRLAFRGEFEATRRTVAKGVAIHIKTPDGVTVTDVGGYPLTHVSDGVVFHPGTMFGGQTRTLWVKLDVAANVSTPIDLGAVTLQWNEGSDLLGKAQVVAMGKVTESRDEHSYVSSFATQVWAQGVSEEEYGSLKLDVAKAVRSGRKDEAIEKIHAYKNRNIALNRTQKSSLVQQKIDNLHLLEGDVNAAFSGHNQHQKQNVLGKSYSSTGMDSRRSGTKYKR